MMEITTYYSIRNLNQEAWDEIVPHGSIFQTYNALVFFEEKGLDEYPPVYFVCKNSSGRIIAHTVAYVIKTDLLIFSKGILKKIVNKIRNVFPNFLYLTILEHGCPMSPGKPLAMHPELDFKRFIEVLSIAMRKEAKTRCIQLMLLRDFYESDSHHFQILYSNGFKKLSNLPTTTLNIRWGNFEDYLKSMRSRYRAKYKRGQKLARTSGLTVEIVDEFSELSEQLARQWKNVNDLAKEYTREQITPTFYKHINTGFNNKCRLLKIFRGEDMVAHAIISFDDVVLRWLFFGREEAGTKDGAYFIAIKNIIQYAIDHKVDYIEMGLTSYSTKTDFGAQMIPLWMFLKCRNKILNSIVPLFFNAINKNIEISHREVFN